MKNAKRKSNARFLLPPLFFLLGIVGCLILLRQALPALDETAKRAAVFAGLLPEADAGRWKGEVSWPEDAAVFSLTEDTAVFDPFSGEPAQTVAQAEQQQDPPPMPENPVEILEEQFSSVGRGDMYIAAGKGYIRNMTSSLSKAQVQSEAGKLPDITIAKTDEPQVLIIHTHATESYERYDVGYGDAEYAARSTDNSENVVAVGAVIADQLEEAGIRVIHDTTQHDNPSYNGSYDRSLATVESYLEQYPSIQVVLDIHRDAIEREDGVRVKPTVKIGEKKAAQVMLCVGCGSDSAKVPEYRHNLRFGALLQDVLQRRFPSLARPLYLCDRNYNLHLTRGSILIEIGGHANTLEEALYSGEMVGQAVAEVLEKLM